MATQTVETLEIKVDAKKLETPLLIASIFTGSKEETLKDHEISSKNTKMKIAKKPPEQLLEQMEFVNLKPEEATSICKIEGEIFYQILKNTAPLIENENLNITFEKDKIKALSIDNNKTTASIHTEPHPCKVEEPISIYISKQSLQKLISFSKAFRKKELDILVSKDKTKFSIVAGNIANVNIITEESGTPDITSVIENIENNAQTNLLMERKEIEKAIEIIKTVDPEASTITKAEVKKNKINLKMAHHTGSIEEEIETIPSEDEKLEFTFIPKTLEKAIKITDREGGKIRIFINKTEKGDYFLVKSENDDKHKVSFAGAKE